jgi:hypothetical protein
MHLKECDSYLVKIIESACEQLKCEFSSDPFEFPADFLDFVLDEFASSRYLLASH